MIMAKQLGDIIIEGTIADITFYKMDGKGYARRKSSLTGKRVKKDPRFRRSMQSANRLGRGSQLASRVYRSLPRTEQVYGLFTELKSIAVRVLKEGASEETVLALLQQRLAKKNTTVTPLAVKEPMVRAVRAVASFNKKLFVVRGGSRAKVARKERRPQCIAKVQRE
jgi:hypothetical protein